MANIKLTKDDVIKIRLEYASGRTTMMALAEKYRVSYACISKVVHFKSWEHVDGPRPNVSNLRGWRL